MGVTTVLRVHPDPTYLLTPPLDPPGLHRFDDPQGRFVVRYGGESLRGCLLETMVQFRRHDIEADLAAITGLTPGDRDPTIADGVAEWLGAQQIARFRLDTDSLIDVNDASVLARMDKHPLVRHAIANSGIETPLAPQHLDEALIRLGGPVGRKITQAVSRAVWEWEPECAGLTYASHHDDTERCYAIYDRARSLDVLDLRPLDPTDAETRRAIASAARLFEIALPESWV